MYTYRCPQDRAEAGDLVGAGSIGDACTRWVGSVGHCRGTDLVAAGTGEGAIRLFRMQASVGRQGRMSLARP